MHVLLLRLAGPMQSWGVQSRFTVRETGKEPSKSGVIGLLCASLGRSRGEDISDLSSLRMGVRVDQEGTVAKDFHTASNILKADTTKGIKETEVSTRYYLEDAKFLVGLEGEDLTLLKDLANALKQPRWPQYLGRKSFVPGEPIWLKDGIRENTSLVEELKGYPWIGSCYIDDPPETLRVIVEDTSGAEVRPDQPRSFSERRFAPRHTKTIFTACPAEKKEYLCTSHD